MIAKVSGSTVLDFPYSYSKLRRDNPNVSFPRDMSVESMADYGVVAVTVAAEPAYDPATHIVEEDALPTKVGDSWVLQSTVRALTQEELDSRQAKSIAVAEDAGARLFFSLCRVLVEDGIINPNDPRLAQIKTAYQEWKTLKGL